MFEKIKDSFYQSLSESIKNKKNALKLKRNEILTDERRVSKIVNAIRNKHYPYLICRGEYPRLNYLFQCENYKLFIKENDLTAKPEDLIKKSGNNYDEMLWGHIDWDKMFQDVLTELSELDSLERLEMQKLFKDTLPERLEMQKLFRNTLVDYAPYAVIRYDELAPEYGRVYIFPDERKEKRQNAIERVHLRHGSELFKQTFLEKFSGKTLREFDKGFTEFVSEYLEKRMPDKYSLGLQAYNFHINLSKFAADWQKLPEVQYGDVSDKKSNLEILLEKYIENGREQMRKLEEYQQEFDNLHIDIK